jgi:signal transduction histidine kinase
MRTALRTALRRRKLDDDAVNQALADLDKFVEMGRWLDGLVESSVWSVRAAAEARHCLGIDLVSIAIQEPPGVLQMRGVAGARTEAFGRLRVHRGAGIGGKVLATDAPVAVADYAHDPSITRDYCGVVVDGEGIGGMSGVPISHGGHALGVLYAARRSVGELGDRLLDLQLRLAGSLAPSLFSALTAERAVNQAVHAERYRIARDLHDQLGHILFGIGVSAQRGQERATQVAPDLVCQLQEIEAQASRAASFLRETFHTIGDATGDDALSIMARVDADAFSQRSGVPVHVVVLGSPIALPRAVAVALITVVREGLHNVEKHAAATSVILTVHFTESEVSVIIQDDGVGLTSHFELRPYPAGSTGWGLVGLSQRIEGFGGRLVILTNEDGGVTLRTSVPVNPDQ